MTDPVRRARALAPAGLVLFAAFGAAMSDLPPLALAAAVLAIALGGGVLAWHPVTGWPLAVGMVVPGAGLVAIAYDQSANLGWMGFCVLVGWVALTSPLVTALAVEVAIAGVLFGQWLLDTGEPGWTAWFAGTTFTLVSCVFARRLRETVVQLEAAQGQLAERSRAEERNRIAGEMHDVIGHALTVSLLHISGARLALDEDPDEARRALAEAERLARSSLDEVRATVGLMRTDASGEVAPLPDAGDIGALVDSFRRAGAEVALEQHGDPTVLGPARGLAAYRIVQEALTNATRHAPGEPVSVLVGEQAGRVTLRVVNGGVRDADPRPGNGLRGMAERATSVGGELRAGPQEGGWLVEARLAR